MKRYTIKSAEGCRATLEILSETTDGYRVRIVRAFDGYEEVEESVMTMELFDLCVRTQFIRPCPEGAMERVA